jgi:hypothetical protein
MTKVKVTVVDVETKKVQEFTLDPTKTTYVVPEGSKFGFKFEPEQKIVPPAEAGGDQ